MNDVCSVALLANAVANRLTADEEAALYDHLEHCESCCARMEQLAGGEQWQQEAASLLATDELDAAVPEPMVWSEVDFSVEHLEPSNDANVLGQLGGYDVLAIIGRGGMGVVLKAFDRELKRFVAIKALSPHLAHSSVARKRFAREAQAAAAVVNPHVIAIHHVQPTGRLPFLIMPLLTGETLAQRLKSRAPLELTEVLRIGMQAAVGLAAAHDQGLVHRDVKPANIFLEKGVERVVITDFGLARAADDVSMTRMGVVAGTPEYMSPEQARGEALDCRSDLFSLGCVLYEMATGVSPFRSDSTIATLRRIVDDKPAAIASLAPELPPWFSYIVERLLSKDPAQRFASASEVSLLLEQCLSHLQQPTSVPLPASLMPHANGRRSIFRSIQKEMLIMLGSLGMALLGIVLWQATDPPDISGEWTSDEWGNVVLESTGAGKYEGTFSGTAGSSSNGDGSTGSGGVTTLGGGRGVMRGSTGPRTGTGKSGTLRLKWSRLERRFNGTWSTGENALGFFRKGTTENQGNSSVAMDVMPEDGVLRLRGSRNDVENAADFFTKGTEENQGNEKTQSVIQNSLPEDGVRPLKGSRNDVMNRNGKMSLRLVDKEIRGGFTTEEEAQLESGTPLLGDLLWTRNQEKPATEKASDRKNITATELEKQIQLAGRELFYGRLELIQEFKTLWAAKDQKRELVTSTGTARWLKKGGLTRIESDRMVPGTGTSKLQPEQWTTGQDGDRAYSWNRVTNSINYGALRPGALAYAPNLFFWGRSGIAFPQPMFGPDPTITQITRDGREEIDVVVEDPQSRISVRYVGIVPDRGHLPTRVETRNGDRLESQAEFQDFFQPRPGVWAARTILWTAWSADDDVDGNPIVASRTKFTVVKLALGDDARLEDEEFRLELPDDVTVVDAAADAPAPAVKALAIGKPLDRQNARAVVEAFLAAALAGRIDEAVSLTEQTELAVVDKPGYRNATAAFFSQFNVQRLAIKSVYVNERAKPVRALAISEAVKLAGQRPDGQRDGIFELTLTMSEDGWFVRDYFLCESAESADHTLKKFLEANPNSIDLPPMRGDSASVEVDETLKSLIESLKPIQGDWVVESLGPWFYPADKLGDSAVSHFVMRIRTNHVELRPFPHSGEQPVSKLLLLPIQDAKPGHFQVDTDPSAVDQRFCPGEFSFEVQDNQLQVKLIPAKPNESNPPDQGSEASTHFSARRATDEEQRKFAQNRFQHMRMVGYKNADRTNPEAVVEAYVAASLAGDVAIATCLAEGYAARPDQSTGWNKHWNLNDFAIKSVRVRGKVVTPMRVTAKEAIVVSELMRRTSPVNEGDVSFGHHVSLLKNVDGNWVISAFDLWTTEHYNQGIEEFLSAAQNSLNDAAEPRYRSFEATTKNQPQEQEPGSRAPQVTFGQPQRSLNVSQVLKEGRVLSESEEVVVVRFRVATAQESKVGIDTKNDIWETCWILSSEPKPYDEHPLAFSVTIRTKALDELKKNGVEDVAKHFVGKILEVEGQIGMTLSQDPLLQKLRFQLGDLPNEQVAVAYYGTEVYSVDQIQEAKADSLPSNDGAKTLDQKNIRSVIEVYVAAALQGDPTTAASVAIVEGKPAAPKQIEPQIQAISRSLKLKQLAMQSIYLNDWEHPTGALAISESVTHAEKQRNGERTGFVMLELRKIEDNWFVSGVEFRTKDAPHERLTQFFEANPKSIDLPPLTPNSLPQRNPVDAVDSAPKEVPENAEKSLPLDVNETSPIEQPLDRKNTPAEADYDSSSEPVPAQSPPAEQGNEQRAMPDSKEAVEVQTRQILD